MPLPPIGSRAPDFTLPSTSGSDVSLSSLKGKKVLLAFFPLAFTGVCTREMLSFTEDAPQFRDADTVVLPISVDSIPSLKAFKEKENFGVELLSDFRRDVCRRYGTLLEDKFHSSRAYVIIDRDGIVRWTHQEDTTRQRREDAELLRELEKID